MIPGVADTLPRDFLLGYFFPAALFVITVIVFWVSMSPLSLPPLIDLLPEDDWAKALAALFLAASGIAATLQAFDSRLLRIFEGFWIFPLSKLSGLLKSRSLRRWDNIVTQISGLKAVNTPKSYDEAYELEQIWVRRFPSDRRHVLPTRFGNILAAFEYYPYRRYGMDAITLWPRLFFVAPKEQREMISSARVATLFFVNISVLSQAFSILILIFYQWLTFWELVASMGAGIIASIAAYYLSLSAGIWWGEAVKTAFDLYRIDLLRQMKVKPQSSDIGAAEERDMWEKLQWGMKYNYIPSDLKFDLTVTNGNAQGDKPA